MTNDELRKLSRRDLLELLIEMEQNNETLRARVNELEASLGDRAIHMESAGTLAEASLALSGIFENADKAAAQYLENIKRCSEQQKTVYDRIVGDAERKAKEILDNAERERQQKQKEAEEYWNGLTEKLEAFYREHIGLRELLSIHSQKSTSEN